jgi:Leucine-rich repeat (LRR) protein
MTGLWYDWYPMDVVRRLKERSSGNIPMSQKERFLSSIEFLDLTSLRLAIVPEFVKEMKNLKSVNLSNNFIKGSIDGTMLPEGINVLNLSDNLITRFSFNGFSTTSLLDIESVNLEGNQLTEVPESFSNVVGLMDINLKDNNIVSIDQEFVAPKNIIKIDLSSNDMERFDILKGALTSCVEFNLSGNRIRVLSEQVFKQKALRDFYLSDNPIEDWEIVHYGKVNGIAIHF